MSLKEISSLRDYAGLMQEDKQRTKGTSKRLLISVTNFFRDPESIEALAATVVPAILERQRRKRFLRSGWQAALLARKLTQLPWWLSEALPADVAHTSNTKFRDRPRTQKQSGRAREGFLHRRGSKRPFSPEGRGGSS
jgi:hypothetical protein